MGRNRNNRLWAARDGAMLLNRQPMLFKDLAFYVLWLTAPVLQTALVVQMFRRKLASELPIFCGYTVLHVIRTLVLAILYSTQGSNSVAYFCAFWAGDLIDVGLGIAVTYEIYSLAFRRYPALAQLGGVLFRWAAVVLLLIAIISASAAPGSESNRLMAGLLILDRSADVVRGGLLLFLFIFARSFGLTWRHYVFGIAAGFSLYASVQLAAIAIRTHLGTVAATTLVMVNMASYDCAILVWVGYFFRREPVSDIRTTIPESNLDKWNQALAELLYSR